MSALFIMFSIIGLFILFIFFIFFFFFIFFYIWFQLITFNLLIFFGVQIQLNFVLVWDRKSRELYLNLNRWSCIL